MSPEPITIPPYLVGETVALLVFTGHGSDLRAATITALTPHGGSWTLTAELTAAQVAINLVPVPDPDADPMSRTCEGCHAEAGEPCRWTCLSHHDGQCDQIATVEHINR